MRHLTPSKHGYWTAHALLRGKGAFSGSPASSTSINTLLFRPVLSLGIQTALLMLTSFLAPIIMINGTHVMHIYHVPRMAHPLAPWIFITFLGLASLSWCYRWRKWASENFRDLCKATQLISRKTKIRDQGHVIRKALNSTLQSRLHRHVRSNSSASYLHYKINTFIF